MTEVKSINLTAIKELLELRLFAYDVLRRTFLQEPTTELIAEFRNGVIDFFPFKDENRELKQGIEHVHHYLRNVRQSHDNFEALHWDYTRMFIGPYELPAPIWESSYVNKDGLLFQAETMRVRRLYLQYNFEPMHYGLEADDHLGLELDFMYQLNNIAMGLTGEDRLNQLNKVLSDQHYFLKAHLLSWTPHFVKDVVNHSKTDFYKGMAKVLYGFLIIDQACLEQMLAELN